MSIPSKSYGMIAQGKVQQDTASKNPAIEEAISETVASKGAASEAVASEAVASEAVASEAVAFQGAAHQGAAPSPANRVRGEASLNIEGKAVLLRPSFHALVAAEEDLGSLFALVERAGAGELTLREMTCLFWHCAIPANDQTSPSQEQVGEAIMEMGLARCAPTLKTLLGQVLRGPE